jgi:hypothetical protein
MKLSVNIKKSRIRLAFLLLALLPGLDSCKKFVEVPPPLTSINSSNVYSTNATAAAVVTGLYQNMVNDGNILNLSVYPGLSADELQLNSVYDLTLNQIYANSLTAAGNLDLWSPLYSYIFIANSAIEGINQSQSLTPAVKQQLLGEAKFCRAFLYFHLVNLYGGVPLALTSDYKANSILDRASESTVYKQIISDLVDAQSKLSGDFLDGSILNITTERVRPTKWAATALLARTYLYTNDYSNAAIQASKILTNSAQFNLVPLSDVFLMNNNEAILQFQSTNEGQDTQEARYYIIPPTGPNSPTPVGISSFLLNAFEPNDQRKTIWIQSVNVAGTTFYYNYKYKNNTPGSAITEYETVFRLAEQYLIRAEAESNLGNTSGAVADLNVIRSRAGLSNYLGATDKTSLLYAILHERQVELFAEWGQRWFDLKRTAMLNSVMTPLVSQKGGTTWLPYQSLYPVPRPQILIDIHLMQNPGY